jgi:hypothetical protein
MSKDNNKSINQTNIDPTLILQTCVKWLASPLNLGRDATFRSEFKTIVNNIGGICDNTGTEPIPLSQSTITTDKNKPVQITLKSTNPKNQYITFLTLTDPSQGKISNFDGITGNLTYTPNTDVQNVTDSFDFTINVNGTNSERRATVKIGIGIIVITPTPTPIPGGGVDKFGIKKIYADDVVGSSWFMNMDDPLSDPRCNNPESSSYMPKMTKNSDGSWKIKNQLEIRWAVSQDEGYDQSKLCTDFQVCASQGYMQSPKDWKDIEMTGYYRVNACGTGSQNGECHVEHVSRGQRSTTSNTPVGKCGCAIGCSDNYHLNSYPLTGRQKYEKDLFHTTGYSKDITGVNNGTATKKWNDGKWIGIKTIVYNLPDGSVQLEHWTDENADNNWKKTHSFVDSDNWPPRGAIGNCNLPQSKSGSPPITFGGPLTVFRSDNIADYDIKWASIRSIKPIKDDNPTPTPTPNPTPTPTPTPIPGSNIGIDGVLQTFASDDGANEHYQDKQPDKNVFNVSYGGGSMLKYTIENENGLVYINTEGSPITYHSGSPPGRSTRWDVYSKPGLYQNKTKYAWNKLPKDGAYLYENVPTCIKNEEFTTIIRVHGDLGTHQSYAHKLGGRNDDTIRSLIEMVHPTATHKELQVNYNYAHFPYVNVKPHIYNNPPTLKDDGKWYGFKTIHYVNPDGKSSHWESWYDDDAIDIPTGKVRNNWKLAATYEDKGTSGYKNVPWTWANEKSVCRIDGFKNVDIALSSSREINPNKRNVELPAEHLTKLAELKDKGEEPMVMIMEADPLESIEEAEVRKKLQDERSRTNSSSNSSYS